MQHLSGEVKRLHEENKTLTENYNSERILRKKYYNMVEDMKGKIRVYCRSRPLSKSELERVGILQYHTIHNLVPRVFKPPGCP